MQNGHFPKRKNLHEIGKSGLVRASYLFFKNINDIKSKLSLATDRKSRNYWTLENTINELKLFIDTNLNFKGNLINKLRKQNRHDLVSAIYKHKGLRELKELTYLNINLRKLSWSEEEVLQELYTLNKEGIEITQDSLKAIGRNDLLGAAVKFQGLNQLKYKLGLKVTRQNYWTDKRIVEELKPLVLNFGRIPSEYILKTLGKGDLASAIHKNGGVKKFSLILDVPSKGYFKANDAHYLQSGYECLFDNILFKYGIPHIVNQRIVPTINYRYDFLIGHTYIEICGYEKKEHPDYYKRLEIKKKFYEDNDLSYRIIPKTFFLRKIELIEKDTLILVSEILPSTHTLCNTTQTDIIPNHYWKDIENVKKELMPLVQKYGRIPLDRELRNEKKSSLIYGVNKFHGSFYEIAKKLNIDIRYKPKGFYTFENAINEYKNLCLEFKRFLTQKELQQLKHFGLLSFIAKNGGLASFNSLTELTYKPHRLPNGYYTMEKAQDEYRRLCIEKKRYISSKELIKIGFGSLADFIQKNGGYYPIREKIGLNFPKLRK